MAGRVRYDGMADWYDELVYGYASEDGTAGILADHLGPAEGRSLLDVGCGTGLHFGVVRSRGWRVIGADLSADQLRVAKPRCSSLVLADGCTLPVRSRAFDVAVATFIHTDVEDFAPVLREVARVLRPGGRFIYMGLHPCFVGFFVPRAHEAETRTLTFTPGYGDSRRTHGGSGDPAGGPGLNRTVGAKWLPLAEFLQAFIQAGLRITGITEFGGVIVPWNVILDATLDAGLPTPVA